MIPPKENPIKLIFFINGLNFKNYFIYSAAVCPIISKDYNIFVDIFLRTKKCGLQKYPINDFTRLISC